MKTNDIRKMSTEEITKKIEELKSELFDMRMKQATAALEKSVALCLLPLLLPLLFLCDFAGSTA